MGRSYNLQDSFPINTLADAERAINLIVQAIRMLSGGYQEDGTLRISIGGLGSDTYFELNPDTKTLTLYISGVNSGEWVGE
ncbi:MAG: hypothetical protein KAV18_06250 [Candidatus Omnitrophica bacterium]|nr:hypothetical protein [Candidatus Omnitrophota bacterium]